MMDDHDDECGAVFGMHGKGNKTKKGVKLSP
jgi:hypothetical protein